MANTIKCIFLLIACVVKPISVTEVIGSGDRSGQVKGEQLSGPGTKVVGSRDLGNVTTGVEGTTTNLSLNATTDIDSSRYTLQKVEFVLRNIYFPTVTMLSVIGNCISISALCRKVIRSNSTPYLLGNAIADLLFSLAYTPYNLQFFETIKNVRSFQNFFAYYFCFGFPFVMIFHTIGVWVTVVFTIQRLFAVAFPLKAPNVFTRRRSVILVGSLFLFGFVFNIYRFFLRKIVIIHGGTSNESYVGYKMSEFGLSAGLVYSWLYVSVTKLVPFPVLITLNSCILWKIWKARNTRLGMTTQRSVVSSQEYQITRILISIVAAFLVCNGLTTGAVIYELLYGYAIRTSTDVVWLRYLFTLGEVLVNTNPLVNCILYTACSKDVRGEIKKILFFKGCRKMPRVESSGSLKPTSKQTKSSNFDD